MIDAHAERQKALYEGIWSQDPDYGTRYEDVVDTVRHRIVPHMLRIHPAQCERAEEIWRQCGLPSKIDRTKPSFGVVDFGAGDGRFFRALREELGDYPSTGRGIAGCIGIDVYQPEQLPENTLWIKAPLWEARTEADYAISTDALEHLPTDMIPATLKNIAVSAPHGFLRISTKQDIYGTERGLHLHETVQPPEWWLEQARAAGIEPSSWRIYPGHAIEIWF